MVRNGISGWMEDSFDRLNIMTTYNLLYNASLMVEEGMGYTLCLGKIIRISGSLLCFRPLGQGRGAGWILSGKSTRFFPRPPRNFWIIFKRNSWDKAKSGPGGECFRRYFQLLPRKDSRMKRAEMCLG